MSREPYTVNLFPRPNTDATDRIGRDVLAIVMGATALVLWVVVLMLVLV